ncbi:MAG: glutaredoxin family protein [Gaiellaceae bacterium MAG52_C11]|nr:glutaredoxin family protein [Candidatus Gaiellasilicea maunaloa]
MGTSARVVIYTASGCHLCDAARENVVAVCGEEFATIDITGDAELEARYRESIPVIEIDGVRAFTYFVQPEALRHRLGERPR